MLATLPVVCAVAKNHSFTALCTIMKTRKILAIACRTQEGKQIIVRGTILSIGVEDGSGNNWIVKIGDQTVFMKTA